MIYDAGGSLAASVYGRSEGQHRRGGDNIPLCLIIVSILLVRFRFAKLHDSKAVRKFAITIMCERFIVAP